jgi:hypothetical protein
MTCEPFTYNPGTDAGKVRLLLNDVDADTGVFDDDEIAAFLTLSGGYVLLAAAQAIDTNADNEALASKVLRTQDLGTDGAKVADALRARAASLRKQWEMLDDDAGHFEIVEMPSQYRPELTEGVVTWPW